MNIQIDRNDIEKLLNEFFPKAKYAKGKLQIELNNQKTLTLEKTNATVSTALSFGRISGDMSLNIDLIHEKIDGSFIVK